MASDEPLIGNNRYDYADAFEIQMPGADARSAEQVVRYALEQAPWPVRATIRLAHQYLLRFRLGPRSAPDHVSGWNILASQPDLIHFEAVSPLLGRGVMVLRRPDPTRWLFATYLLFARPMAARFLWTLAGPLHRRFAPYLMERATADRQPVGPSAD